MEELNSHFGLIITIGGAVVLGIVALFGVFDKRRREIRNEENGTEDRVIKLLKTEVEELTKKVNKQTADLENLTAEVEKLKAENHTLVQVLQGKDAATIQFQKDAYMAMGQIKDLVATSKQTSESVTKLATLMEGFMKTKN